MNIAHLHFWNSKEGKKFMPISKNCRGSISYASALKRLGNRESIKLCYETHMRKEHDGNVYIRYFRTDIITLRPDGTTILNNGGWHTVTTKERLSTFTDINVWTENGDWAIRGSDGILYEYENGVTISAQGIPDTCPLAISVLARVLGVEAVTESKIGEVVAGLDMAKTESLWKRCWKYRDMIAKYCSEKFLPLTLGSRSWRRNEPEKEWRKIVSDRLRGVSNACTA
jgi:hypothetical protein